jgi:hypothetical protein
MSVEAILNMHPPFLKHTSQWPSQCLLNFSLHHCIIKHRVAKAHWEVLILNAFLTSTTDGGQRPSFLPIKQESVWATGSVCVRALKQIKYICSCRESNFSCSVIQPITWFPYYWATPSRIYHSTIKQSLTIYCTLKWMHLSSIFWEALCSILVEYIQTAALNSYISQ